MSWSMKRGREKEAFGIGDRRWGADGARAGLKEFKFVCSVKMAMRTGNLSWLVCLVVET